MYVGSENIFQDQKTTRPADLKELFSSFCILISSLICLSVCLPAFLAVSLSLCCMYNCSESSLVPLPTFNQSKPTAVLCRFVVP